MEIVFFLGIVTSSIAYYTLVVRRTRTMVKIFDTLYLITSKYGTEQDKEAYNKLTQKYRTLDGQFLSSSNSTLWSLKRDARLYLLGHFGTEKTLQISTEPIVKEILTGDY